MFGNALQVKRDPLGFLTACAREHGDVVSLRFVNQIGYLINNPNFIETILVKNSDNFIKQSNVQFKPSSWIYGNELLGRVVNFPADGQFWSSERKLIQPAFHHERIRRYGAVMASKTEKMIADWKDGQVLNIHQEMMRLALEVVAYTMFDSDVSNQADRLMCAFDAITHEIFLRTGNPLQLPVIIPIRRNLQLRKAVDYLSIYFEGVVREHLESGRDGNDFLSLLIQVFGDDRRRGMQSYWRYQAMSLLIAGFETTALAITWAWYLLAQNPQCEKRLHEELSQILGNRLPTVDDIPKLVYTEMVIKESLRLYPPVWLFGARIASQDYTLGPYTLPGGSFAIVSPWVTQRDPRFFDQPEAFRPERWIDASAKSAPKYAYFPFSAGPRHCIGHSYAMMEAIMTIASVAQRYRLELLPDPPVVLQPQITLRPRYGMSMLLHRRT